jgi:hypothetical protein
MMLSTDHPVATVSCNPDGTAAVSLSEESDQGKYQLFQATVMLDNRESLDHVPCIILGQVPA